MGLLRMLALGAMLWLLGRAAAGDTLTYTLEPRPETGSIKVEFTWKTEGRGGSLMGVSPRWGNVTDVPALLGDFVVEGAKSVKRDGARWIVAHKPDATFTVRYEVKPPRRSFDWESTHLPITTSTFFHGMGNAFLLVPESGGDVPREFDVVLRWKVPDEWRAACSWGVGRSVGSRIAATDLRHSVYLAGDLVVKTASDDGRKIALAMVGRFGFKPDDLLAVARRIIAAECEFMNEQDFPSFVITAIPVGQPVGKGNTRASGSGLYNSFALFMAPDSRLNDAVEHLFAHELFHYWNGRLLAAANPEELVYWWIEGFTDYYALRILHESGYWNDGLFLKWLNRHVREYYANPAIAAPNEEIGRDFWKKRETVGQIAYQRGLMLGLRWHAQARGAGVADGLDKLLRTLLERARTSRYQLDNDSIRRAGVELLGAWFGPEFDRYVMQASTIDLPADALAPQFVLRDEKVFDYELGFDREKSLPKKKIIGLVPDSAAAKAGLREGDVLGGWSIRGNTDEKVELQVQRDGKSRTISYFPRAGERQVPQFAPAAGEKKTPPEKPPGSAADKLPQRKRSAP